LKETYLRAPAALARQTTETNMGQAKRMLEEIEATRTWAVDFLVSVGTLKECPYHDSSYYDGNGDLEYAYRVLNSKISKGEITLARGQTRRDLTDALKDAYDDNSGLSRCSWCARHDDE